MLSRPGRHGFPDKLSRSLPAGPIPSGSSDWNMGQSLAPRKRAKRHRTHPAAGRFPIPAIPSRLINSGEFDKTAPAPVWRRLTVKEGFPRSPYFTGESIEFPRSGLPPVQQPLTRWPRNLISVSAMPALSSARHHIAGTARRFAQANGGNIAVIFAFAMLPILAFIGAAIDYSRANKARSAMQAALDSAALMVSKDLSSGHRHP
jgi:hypothetical protein